MTEQFGVFDFGLTAAQEERAARLHRESIVIDMLFQGPLGYRHFNDTIVAEHQKRLQGGEPRDKVFWSGVIQLTRHALKGELPDYETVWRESGLTAVNRDVSNTRFENMARWGALWTACVDRFDWMVKALRAADIRRAKSEGRVAAYINHQADESFPYDLSMLDTAYDMGLRVLMLTYNNQTNIGSGCTDRGDVGLSKFGVKVVKYLNDLGIIVDTSHCSRQTTLDACEFSKAPVIATHSSAQGLYPHNRGKSDEEIRALAATGGLIGIVTVPFFLKGGKGVTIEAFLDHVDYIANLVGWQYIGIGTDWPMMASKWALETIMNPMTTSDELGFSEADNIDAVTNLVGFDDYRDMPNITRGLVKRGYSDEQIKGILGENFLRVFEQVCG